MSATFLVYVCRGSTLDALVVFGVYEGLFVQLASDTKGAQ